MSTRLTPAGRERRRVLAPLALAAGLAWALLALGAAGIAVPAICSAARLWSVPSPDAFGFALAFASPASLAAGWALMVAAMMLPTVHDPLVHLRARTLRRLRPPCLALFLAAWLGVWTLAGAAFLAAALALRLASPDAAPFLAAAAVALLWQASPWKQAALNRCHRRPALAAFGPAAYRSAFAAGLRHGLACLASCWALMAAALLAPVHPVPVMAAVAVLIWTERLDPARPPAWRLRLPGRTLRMLARVVGRRRRPAA